MSGEFFHVQCFPRAFGRFGTTPERFVQGLAATGVDGLQAGEAGAGAQNAPDGGDGWRSKRRVNGVRQLVGDQQHLLGTSRVAEVRKRRFQEFRVDRLGMEAPF